MPDQLDLFAVDAFKVDKPKSTRTTGIDLIYTLQGADATCCLAVRAGMKYGIQSKSFRLCPYIGKHKHGEHAVVFIDNAYQDYVHTVHIAGIKRASAAQKWPIKYATVRDIMTPEQCQQAGIEHFDFDQIMDWAEEIAELVENVIVIPKYECLDRIPEKYILGYSVPSSHGGTPLLPEAFFGRRVHLLGGSWHDQIKYWLALWDEVVSLDNNHCHSIARFGKFYMPSGKSRQISQDLHLDQLSNPRYVALAISFGNMVGRVRELEQSA